VTAKALVFYDGDCRFCVSSVAKLKAMDVGGRLEFKDARDPGVLRAHPEVSPARALERMQLVRPEGGAPLEGFDAFRWIAVRLPALRPLAPLLWLPGMGWIGRKLYDRVARSRFGFGRCEGGACEVEPPTSR
jgi:predicted DCC family thiol-disulfide oxidoreductase YuxK